jgi:hypothetical protein
MQSERQGTIPFRHVIVDQDNPPDPHCKAAGDIDGDGHPDLLAASAAGGGLFWYRYPDWRKHRIADGTFTTDMKVASVSGYGDVVIPNDDGLMWYKNPGGVCGDPAEDPWEAINISPDGARMHDVEVADLDGDGRLDIVTRHQSGFGKMMGDAIHVWKQDTPTSWRHHTFPCPHGEGLAVADINGNGRPDIIIGGRWYANPGEILGGAWMENLYMPREHFDQNWTNGDVVVQAGDLNGNGRIDIVLSPAEGTGRLSWFEAPEDLTSPEWVEHVIESAYDHAHGLGVADIDADGHLDVVVAKMHQATAPQEVAVYLNREGGDSWEKQVVSTQGSHNIVLVDIGSNGRMDIYGANWNNRSSTKGAVELWMNQL